MGEYFELTFFSSNSGEGSQNKADDILSLLMLAEGRTVMGAHHYSLFSSREVLFDVFEDRKCYEYRICLSDFIFTKKNYSELKNQLLEVADACLTGINSLILATGIYEITCEYIDGETCIEDLDIDTLRKFPFVFFKKEHTYGLPSTKQYNNILYVVNTGCQTQNIFSDE